MIVRMKITRETEETSLDIWVNVEVDYAEGAAYECADDEGNEFRLTSDERDQAYDLMMRA